MIAGLTTEGQRMVSFYISWFNRVYETSDSGWVVARTPDGLPIAEQDAYFWFALEIIARTLNEMRAVELAALHKQ